MQYPNGRILVFAKLPVAGQVKTRLIPVLGEQGAADLQRDLIDRTLRMVLASRLAPVQLWASGEGSTDSYAHDESLGALTIHAQIGEDLGQRMGLAIAEVLREADFAVLIGTDCPAMSPDYLAQACAGLASGTDIVLGPAEDGGYVLIAMRHHHPDLFAGIAWGSSMVLDQTRKIIKSLDMSCLELATLWDVDRAEDLVRMRSITTGAC